MAKKEQAYNVEEDIIRKTTDMLIKKGYDPESSRKNAEYCVKEYMLAAERFMLSEILTTSKTEQGRKSILARLESNRQASEQLNKQYFQKQ
jgi:hypothetical protein